MKYAHLAEMVPWVCLSKEEQYSVILVTGEKKQHFFSMALDQAVHSQVS